MHVHKNITNTHFLIGAFFLYVLQVTKLNIVQWDPFQAFCSFLIFFALGARVADTSLLQNLKLFDGLRLSAVAIGGYVLIAVAVAANVSNMSEMPFLHAVLAVMGTFATIALAMLLSRSSIWWFVRVLGIYSLEIYVSHTIFCAATRNCDAEFDSAFLGRFCKSSWEPQWEFVSRCFWRYWPQRSGFPGCLPGADPAKSRRLPLSDYPPVEGRALDGVGVSCPCHNQTGG